MSVDSRTKFVYLSYDDITTSIGNGILDEYDMCITKDTHEIYVIREDLTPFAIKTKVYIFDSVEEANSFVAPDWFGEDVTHSGKYHNSYLSRHGLE